MLDGQINVRANSLLRGDEIKKFVGHMFRKSIQKTKPLDIFSRHKYFFEQSCETFFIIKIQAVRCNILADDVDFFNAQPIKFFHLIDNGFYFSLDGLRKATTQSHAFELLVDLKNFNESLHSAMHTEIYKEIGHGQLEEEQISTLLNVNRELYLSNKSLLEAIADAVLDMDGARDYESLPSQQR